MNILFDIGHPAHFHLFKNFIQYLKDTNAHNITITTRDKDVTSALLDHHAFEYIVLSKPGTGKIGLINELLKRNVEIFKLHKKNKFDLAFGTSVSIGHLSQLTRVKSINFNEDDDDVVPFYTYLAYPFCSVIVNPDCIRFRKWRSKRIFVNSYHELAYLHPNNFQPDENVLNKYNLKKRNYIIVRFSALNAHHDARVIGISKKLLNKIYQNVKDFDIIESLEGSKSYQIEPWDMHHVMAFAKLVISDSQTMTAEAAVMGVPSIRINTFVERIRYLRELEDEFKLTYGFLPENDEKVFEKFQELLNDENLQQDFGERKKKMLLKKTDMNEWMVKYFNDDLVK